MLKRTLYIGQNMQLSTRLSQLVLLPKDAPDAKTTVPIEDIGMLILDHHSLYLSHTCLQKLIAAKVAILSCNEQHHPCGMWLPFEGNIYQHTILHAQTAATPALQNKLWQSIVRQKIHNQAKLLQHLGYPTTPMFAWAAQVQPNDPQNLEARAAAYYWKYLFEAHVQQFSRGRYEDAPNFLLNYGYAILRATIARSLVAAGLHPTFGIHHHNQYNAFCLADDLMESFRPSIDQWVLYAWQKHQFPQEMTKELRRELLQIPALDVRLQKQKHPLMVAAQYCANSLAQCYTQKKNSLKQAEICLISAD
ncbi:MAG: type II CRISPR-associated endonuclease Cas1 [Chitinophagales bacterium]|nr:type II CRISPR-associated endonuclease Cas1 [Bacteroidota bacterium]